MGNQPVYIHDNFEIVNFDREYRLVIFKACADAGLRRGDWETVENLVLEKYAQGKIECDPTREAVPYVYTIAKNCASDERRKQRLVEFEGNEMLEICDERNHFAKFEKDDVRMIVEEAFRRLVSECRDKEKVQILLRYVVNGESRARIAEELGVESDYVSLVKNRWLPRLQALVRGIVKEEQGGKLKFSTTDIGFLKQYMRNW